jgi:uncharacterized protein YwqG
MLAFFYDTQDHAQGGAPGDAGCGRVLFFPERGLQSVPVPEELSEPHQRLNPIPVAFDRYLTIPSIESALVKSWKLDDEAQDSFMSFYEEYPASREGYLHQLLGWPTIVDLGLHREMSVAQGDAHYQETLKEKKELEADWCLLAQFDNDEEVGLRLAHEAGRLFYLIRREDLAKADFSRVLTVHHYV